MNIKQYFEYKKENTHSNRNDFLNILNKIEISENKKQYEVHNSYKIHNSLFNIIGLKYFTGGVALASIIYLSLFYITQQNTPDKSLVIRENDITIESINNAIDNIDTTSEAFK